MNKIASFHHHPSLTSNLARSLGGWYQFLGAIMDKITIPFYSLSNPNGVSYVDVEPIEVRGGFALHRTIIWNGFTLDTYTITHIKSGLAAGNSVDNIDVAMNKLQRVSEIEIGNTPIGQMGKCELVQLMPVINDMAAVSLGFKKLPLTRLLRKQRVAANLLKC